MQPLNAGKAPGVHTRATTNNYCHYRFYPAISIKSENSENFSESTVSTDRNKRIQFTMTTNCSVAEAEK